MRRSALVREAIDRGGETSSAFAVTAYRAGVPEERRAGAGARAGRRCAHRSAMWASALEARTSAFAGRTQAAHALYQRAVQVAHRRAASTSSPRSGPWKMPNCTRSPVSAMTRAGKSRRGSRSNRDNFTLERAGRAHALCGAADAVAACPTSSAARFPAATLTARIHRPVIAAALAVSAAETSRGRSHCWIRSRPYDHAPAAEFWPAYLRGAGVPRIEEAARRPPRSSRASWSTAAKRRPRRSTRWRTAGPRVPRR